MKDTRVNLPLSYKAMNLLGRVLVGVNAPALRLDEETITAAAVKFTGLSDFGDPYYREGLQVLLESAKKDANLHPIGRFITINMISMYLVQRLRMVETRKTQPELFETPLIPPLIIIGAARSGTTFLHNLLALDPAHRFLPQWQLMRPFPDPGWNNEGTDPRILRVEQGLQFREPLMPELDAKHYTWTDTAEECIILLGITLNSLIFPTLFPVISYMEWYLENAGHPRKYREYSQLLHYFQSQEPEQRLILKAPAHTGNLEPLRQVVPEVMLVQLHRDQVKCITSVCSLLSTFHGGVSDMLNFPRMTDLAVQGYEFWAKRNIAYREGHPGVVYDVMFKEMVSDPIGTVKGIYTHYNLPWTETYEAALEEYIQQNPKNKHGKHHYSASDFGLDEAEIAERMRFVHEYFGL